MTKAVSKIVGMKNWDDEKQCWVAVICQIMLDDKGKEFIQVYDVERARTQIEIDDWIRYAIATKPWEASEGRRGSA
jgi:hypothetical protein